MGWGWGTLWADPHHPRVEIMRGAHTWVHSWHRKICQEVSPSFIGLSQGTQHLQAASPQRLLAANSWLSDLASVCADCSHPCHKKQPGGKRKIQPPHWLFASLVVKYQVWWISSCLKQQAVWETIKISFSKYHLFRNYCLAFLNCPPKNLHLVSKTLVQVLVVLTTSFMVLAKSLSSVSSSEWWRCWRLQSAICTHEILTSKITVCSQFVEKDRQSGKGRRKSRKKNHHNIPIK